MPADFKVEGSSLAFVIDVTGSMGPEIGDIKTGLEDDDHGARCPLGSFPKTAIVTFDDRATIGHVSRDPDRLRNVIAGLTTHSTPDCPEGANEGADDGRPAAGQWRARDPRDRRREPPRAPRAKRSMRCTRQGRAAVRAAVRALPAAADLAAARTAAASLGPSAAGRAPDQAKPANVLGVEGSVRTFSEESLFCGGLFSFQPEIKSGTADINRASEHAGQHRRSRR